MDLDSNAMYLTEDFSPKVGGYDLGWNYSVALIPSLTSTRKENKIQYNVLCYVRKTYAVSRFRNKEFLWNTVETFRWRFTFLKRYVCSLNWPFGHSGHRIHCFNGLIVPIIEIKKQLIKRWAKQIKICKISRKN
jgi:hypothetical protein